MKVFQKKTKRVLAMILAVLMLLSTLTVGVFAEDSEETVDSSVCSKDGGAHDYTTATPEKVTDNAGVVNTTYHILVCTKCKDASTLVKHTFEETVKVKPECEKGGEVTQTCACGYSYDENVKATGHTTIPIVGTVGTCQTKEVSDGKYCVVCNKITEGLKEGDYVTTNHTNVQTVPAVAPTCTETGLTAGTYCADCGVKKNDKGETVLDKDGNPTILAWIEAPQTVKATGHAKEENWVDVEDKAATCTVDGYVNAKKCPDCNAVVSKVDVPALTHIEYTVPAVAATCTTDGCAAYKVCLRPGCESNGVNPIELDTKGNPRTIESYKIAAYNHKLADGSSAYESTPITNATCTTDGEEMLTCSLCGDSYKNTIPAAHKYVAQEDYEGLMNLVETHCGLVSVPEICTVCKATRLKDYQGKADHKWEVTTKVANTCKSTGLEDWYCPVCYSSMIDVETPIVDHKWTTQATYTAVLKVYCGYTAVKQYCAFDGCEVTRVYHAVGELDHKLDANNKCTLCLRQFKSAEDAEKLEGHSTLPVQYYTSTDKNGVVTLYLFASVDSLNYENAGFKVTIGGTEYKIASSSVYTKYENITPAAGSNYLVAGYVKGIQKLEKDATIEVIPFVEWTDAGLAEGDKVAIKVANLLSEDAE